MRPNVRLTGSRRSRLVLLLAGLIALNGAFWVATLLSDLVPDERIAANLVRDISSGDWDIPGRLTDFGGTPDRFTECVAFTQGLGVVSMGENRLERAMADGHLAPWGCEGIGERLQATLLPGSSEATPYFRYWHGYTLVTRPLLAIVELHTVRTLVAMALVASAAFFLVTLIRPLGIWAGLAFIGPLLLTSDLLSLPSSVTHGLTWTVALASAGIAVHATRKWGYWGASATAMYAGSVFVFVDLLTNPPGALVLVLAGVLTGCAVAGMSLRASWGTAALAGLSWAFGYGATWVAKWLISGLAFGFQRVEAEIRGMIAFRLSGTYETVDVRFGSATLANWRVWLNSGELVTPALAACLLISMLLIARAARAGRGEPTWVLPYAAAVAVPPIWYELLSNHSQIHSWFTYRSLPVSLSVLLLGVVVALKGPWEPGTTSGFVAADRTTGSPVRQEGAPRYRASVSPHTAVEFATRDASESRQAGG